LTSRPDFLVCPLCERHELRPHSHNSARCPSCSDFVSGAILETIKQVAGLPDALGRHACECAHPEMRRLPDGTLHCPACRSEVVPVDTGPTLSGLDEHGQAWWAGWMDGQFGERVSFVDNPSLTKWEAPSDRLDYYRGHRAGSEACRDRVAPSLARARKVQP
jgi:hypothetical protein